MKYGQELPQEVEKKLDAYIERVRNIKWFTPSKDLSRSDVDKKVNVVLEAFGVKASIEYRSLKTGIDWRAARDASSDAAWDAASGAAWDAASDAAWDAARDAAWDAAWIAACDAAWIVARDAAWDAASGAAWDAAWGAAGGAGDILALELKGYRDKYLSGSFIHIVPIFEAGLYPCGVIDGKFVVYVPTEKNPMTQFFEENYVENGDYAVIKGKRYKLIEE